MGVNTAFFSKKSVASHSDSREIALWWQWREAARKTSHASSIQQQPQQALVFVRSALSSFMKSRTKFHRYILVVLFLHCHCCELSPPLQSHIFQLPYSFHAKRHYPISLQLSQRVNSNFSHLVATFPWPSAPYLLTVGLSPPLGSPQHQVEDLSMAAVLFR